MYIVPYSLCPGGRGEFFKSFCKFSICKEKKRGRKRKKGEEKAKENSKDKWIEKRMNGKKKGGKNGKFFKMEQYIPD